MYWLARNRSWISSTDANIPPPSPSLGDPADALMDDNARGPRAPTIRSAGIPPSRRAGLGQEQRDREAGERHGRDHGQRRREPPVVGDPAEDGHADPAQADRQTDAQPGGQAEPPRQVGLG